MRLAPFKQSESATIAQIEAAKAKDEAILSSIVDAVCAINTNGEIILFNRAAEDLSGYSNNEAIGKPYQQILKFVNEQTGKNQDQFITDAFERKTKTRDLDAVLIAKDGHQLPVATSAALIQGQNNDVMGVIIVFRDVTEERQIDRAKTEFVSLASHQLRTPLTAINWNIEAVLEVAEGKLPAEQIETLRQVWLSGRQMADLIDALLDITRLELGTFAVKYSYVDIGQILEQVLKDLELIIHLKGLHVQKDIASDVAHIYADKRLIKIIIQNFISNSAKYTETGTLGCQIKTIPAGQSVDGRSYNSSSLYICVQDSGYGIPADQQAKVFTRLFRAENVKHKIIDGTGLGLYTVRKVVDTLKGDVWFNSEENKGTIFHVVLPLLKEQGGKV